jgi:hypothetical protein
MIRVGSILAFIFFSVSLPIYCAFRPADVRVTRGAAIPTMGIRSFIKRKFFPGNQERSVSELKKGIAGFYDSTTGVWLDVWGDHLHHGYYPSPNYRNHSAAQVDMVDRALSFAYGGDENVQCSSMVDVGCGVGGSSRHIASRLGCKAVGVSLSPYQIDVANMLTKEAGLADRLNFQVADAMNMPFKGESFDLVIRVVCSLSLYKHILSIFSFRRGQWRVESICRTKNPS